MSTSTTKRDRIPKADRERRFVDAYLVDFNATSAALVAGYSPRGAKQAGSVLLGRPSVQKLLAKRREDLQRRTEVDQDRVIRELARIAFAAPDDSVACTGEEPRTDYVGVLVKDKLSALDKLAKHLGMYVERVEHSGAIDTPSLQLILKRPDADPGAT